MLGSAQAQHVPLRVVVVVADLARDEGSGLQVALEAAEEGPVVNLILFMVCAYLSRASHGRDEHSPTLKR